MTLPRIFFWALLSLGLVRGVSAAGYEFNPKPPEGFLIELADYPREAKDPTLKGLLESGDFDGYGAAAMAVVQRHPGDWQVEATLRTSIGFVLISRANEAGMDSAATADFVGRALEHFLAAREVLPAGPVDNHLWDAQITYGLAECYDRLGSTEEALVQHRRLAEEFQGVGTGPQRYELAMRGITKVAMLSEQLGPESGVDLDTYLRGFMTVGTADEIVFAAKRERLLYLWRHDRGGEAADVLSALREEFGDLDKLGYFSVATEMERAENLLATGPHDHNHQEKPAGAHD